MKRGPKKRPILDRIAERTMPEPNSGCFLYIGMIDKAGYGRINEDRRGSTALVHRIVYREVFGNIPDGMEIDHKCRVRSCCNPDHLEPVTHLENMRRAQPHWQRATHCGRGHPYTPDNIYWRKDDNRRRCRKCINLGVKRYLERKKAA